MRVVQMLPGPWPILMTFAPQSDRAPSWAPDGHSIQVPPLSDEDRRFVAFYTAKNFASSATARWLLVGGIARAWHTSCVFEVSSNDHGPCP